MARSTIKRQAYRGFRALAIPKNSSISITVNNPCFCFAGGSDSEFTVAFCSGITITNISGNNPNLIITKPASDTLNIVNNFAWRIIVWILDYYD